MNDKTSLAGKKIFSQNLHAVEQVRFHSKGVIVQNRPARQSAYSSFGKINPKPTAKTRVKWREESHNPYGIYGAFLKVCQRWQLSNEDRFKLLGFEPKDPFCQRLLDGSIRRASLDVEDRAGYVVSIGIGLFSLFGKSKNAEIEWLKHPRTRLQNKSPLLFMLEGRMENLFVIDGMVKHERGL